MPALLDLKEMTDQFFNQSAMLGMVTTLPPHKLAWLLNKNFDTNFEHAPERMICVTEKKGSKKSVAKLNNQGLFGSEPTIQNSDTLHYPVYNNLIPNSEFCHILYRLRNGKSVLISELKHLDYLWLIQSSDPIRDVRKFASVLKNMTELQVVQEIKNDILGKSIVNLLL